MTVLRQLRLFFDESIERLLGNIGQLRFKPGIRAHHLCHEGPKTTLHRNESRIGRVLIASMHGIDADPHEAIDDILTVFNRLVKRIRRFRKPSSVGRHFAQSR